VVSLSLVQIKVHIHIVVIVIHRASMHPALLIGDDHFNVVHILVVVVVMTVPFAPGVVTLHVVTVIHAAIGGPPDLQESVIQQRRHFVVDKLRIIAIVRHAAIADTCRRCWHTGSGV
jgi:hypothetical protein